MASWRCLGASEDRTCWLLKVSGVKILSFTGCNEVHGAPPGGNRDWRGADFRPLKRNERKEERVGREEGRR